MSNIQKYIDDAIAYVTEFFNISTNEKPDFVFVHTRGEMDKYCGYKTENWVVAHSENGRIYMFTPGDYEKESCHSYSEEKYRKLIIHETCHFYQDLLTGTYKPLWLGEGLAVYLSGQYKDKKVVNIFANFLRFHSDGGKEIYSESGFVIKKLVERFGKDKLLEYIHCFKENDSEKFAYKKFEEIFGIKLNYKNINSI
jgi:hypothetical protein